MVGVFQRTQKGFGFVRPTQPEPPPAEAGKPRKNDIYIPAKWSSDAASGDVVLVQFQPAAGGERPRAAKIVEIVERRRTSSWAPISSEGMAYVQVDGKVFARPIYVGDPGAKSARPDDKVVIEMVRFPSPLHDGEGVIEEVLGPRGKPGVDTLSIIREFRLPERFAADALEEARRRPRNSRNRSRERRDLTGETIVTIDPVDARDFDDAISLERLENGHWRLGVHIADVSHFVRPRRRWIARPAAWHQRLPARARDADAAGDHLQQPGQFAAGEDPLHLIGLHGVLARGPARAQRIPRRGHPQQQAAHLRAGRWVPGRSASAWRKKLRADVHALLAGMHELAMILRKRRLAHGALELNMPEVKVELDPSGRVSGAHVAQNTESHQIIEEFMLAANEAVAESIARRGLPFLRRIHQSPSPLKLEALTEFVANWASGRRASMAVSSCKNYWR